MDEPNFLIFYCDYRTDETVMSEDQRRADLPEITTRMQKLLGNEPDNFFGLEDSHGNILQFITNEDGSLRIDIPDAVKQSSQVKDTTLEECLAWVEKATDDLSLLNIPGLSWEDWGEMENDDEDDPFDEEEYDDDDDYDYDEE